MRASLSRHLSIAAIQLERSLLVSLQYRFDFVVNLLMSVFWTVASAVPLVVLYESRERVAGWAFTDALVVVGFFIMLKGVLGGVIQPSLQAVVELVRKGTLDLTLTKPVDAQLLVSTANIELWRMSDVLSGACVLVWACRRMGYVPSALQLASAAVMVASATVILYSIFVVVVSLAFRYVKVNNLAFLFTSIYDAARWPASVFRGGFALLFTFVIPLALMTTYPALALLGRLEPQLALRSLLMATVFAVGSRRLWLRAIKHYTSAGG